MMTEDGELVAREARHRVANELGVAAASLRLAAEGRLPPEALSAAVERLETAAAVNLALCRQPTTGLVDLAEALTAVQPPLTRVAAAHGWGIAFNVSSILVPDVCAARLAMIAHELVFNAVRHGDRSAGGVIHVDVRPDPSGLSLSVRDGGEPKTWTRSGGQGARIVDALAAAMGGYVRRGSETEQGGARVMVPARPLVAGAAMTCGGYGAGAGDGFAGLAQ